ncbi:MAG: PhoPQ-activated pathogenicity-related family protein [Spirosomaceae bacterium]|jgi:PhoPQ-activated pathogenicity-related protein|nr:PhoPQ-activated pathogenicity-related family protein [Spirosomataceae bacterium]
MFNAQNRPLLLTRFLICLLVSFLFSAGTFAQSDVLDRYLARPDSVYGWKLQNTIEGKGYKAYIIELTSQSWRTPDEVDRTVWKHWMAIIKPDKLATNKALLFIGGGRNGRPAPANAPTSSVMMAMETSSIVVELGQVPNQPLRFADSKDKERSEDDLIAYTYNKMIDTKDDFWLVRLPMVKSAVRAMDATQEFLRSDAGGKIEVDGFVVSGGSKRGWTTWLTGIADSRVIGMAPAVIDALNTDAMAVHHYEVLGFFTEALGDYVNHGIIPHKVNTPESKHIYSIDDPYSYRNRERMKIPKLVLNASGDQFFLPDNSQFYFKDLPGPKYLRYVPNTKHNLADSDALISLATFHQALFSGRKLPTITWKKKKDGTLVVKSSETPKEVNVWAANNPNARDFRLDVIGKAFKKSSLTVNKKNKYVAVPPVNEKGYTAFFVELVFENGKHPLKFTSEVSITPDIKPFKFADSYKQYADKARK